MGEMISGLLRKYRSYLFHDAGAIFILVFIFPVVFLTTLAGNLYIFWKVISIKKRSGDLDIQEINDRLRRPIKVGMIVGSLLSLITFTLLISILQFSYSIYDLKYYFTVTIILASYMAFFILNAKLIVKEPRFLYPILTSVGQGAVSISAAISLFIYV